MNNKQITQSSNNGGNEISDSIDEMKYLSYLSDQVKHIDETLGTYVELCNRRANQKVSKLNSIILDFIFTQKDNFTLTQSHIDDLDLIAELIMIHYSEETV